MQSLVNQIQFVTAALSLSQRLPSFLIMPSTCSFFQVVNSLEIYFGDLGASLFLIHNGPGVHTRQWCSSS